MFFGTYMFFLDNSVIAIFDFPRRSFYFRYVGFYEVSNKNIGL